MKKTLMTLIGAGSVAAVAIAQSEDGWQSLFNGENLDGWSIKSGFATYEVVDDTIVGTTAEGSPNSFLVTDEMYGNFELEFEVKVDDALNSGCQIRSLLKDVDKENSHGGRLYGPQCEIEASPGQAAWIYGEATGRGWLSPEPDNGGKHEHMKNGEWNQYRIVANGVRIQTWINGEAVADLSDEEIFETHPEGHIGLQVHGIGRNSGPFTVAWRNIRIKPLD